MCVCNANNKEEYCENCMPTKMFAQPHAFNAQTEKSVQEAARAALMEIVDAVTSANATACTDAEFRCTITNLAKKVKHHGTATYKG